MCRVVCVSLLDICSAFLNMIVVTVLLVCLWLLLFIHCLCLWLVSIYIWVCSVVYMFLMYDLISMKCVRVWEERNARIVYCRRFACRVNCPLAVGLDSLVTYDCHLEEVKSRLLFFWGKHATTEHWLPYLPCIPHPHPHPHLPSYTIFPYFIHWFLCSHGHDSLHACTAC